MPSRAQSNLDLTDRFSSDKQHSAMLMIHNMSHSVSSGSRLMPRGQIASCSRHERVTNLRPRASETSNWLGKLFGGRDPSNSKTSDDISRQVSLSEAESVVSESIQETTDVSEVIVEERPDDLDMSPITAEELRNLSMEKYGHCYDMAIVKRVIVGKKLVFLNILHKYLGQRSFSLSEEDYMDKLSAISAFVNAAEEQGKVRRELRGPMKGKNGMPRRPVVGTAVSLSLNVPESVLESWGM